MPTIEPRTVQVLQAQTQTPSVRHMGMAPTPPPAAAPLAEPQRQTSISSEPVAPGSLGAAPADATEVPSEDPLSPKFAALARKEKAQRMRELELKKREEALAARETQTAKPDSFSKNDIAEMLKKSPIEFLNQHGISYDDFTNSILTQQTVDPMVLQLQAKIDELESKQSKFSKDAEENQSKSYEQAVSQIRSEAKALINSSEEFEMIKRTNSTDAVVALIEEVFKEEGQILSIEEAARDVEEELLEQAMNLAQAQKVRAKFTSQEAPVEKIATQAQQTPPTLKTLTHASTTSASKPMTPRERAILAFKGQLNS